jgi:hypothetical protein
MAPAVVRAQTAGAPLSIDAYVAELDRLAAEVEALNPARPDEARRLGARVPREWTIATPDHSWVVPAGSLHASLDTWRRHPDAGLQASMVRLLKLSRQHAASLTQPTPASVEPHARLEAILAEREFRGIHGPTAFDRWKQRALAWVVSVLERVLGSSAVPAITNVVVYVLIALAVVLVAMGMYRALRRGAEADAARLELVHSPARRWDAWLQDAQAAAAAGDWRHAIRLAYWCGITVLEARGAWRTDLSRTPREYLRLLPDSVERDASLQISQALQGITRLLEHVWYGMAPADEAGFDEALSHLKNLGCPSR